MNLIKPGRKLSRRAFLQGAAAVGVTTALGDAVLTSAPWLDYGRAARAARELPPIRGEALPVEMRGRIRAATLAPSGHNTQPWKFAVRGSIIQIMPDFAWRLPAVDPHDRELWISLGCALENLVIAAQAAGFDSEIGSPAPGADILTVLLLQASTLGPHTVPLFNAIRHRQNNRALYDGRPISADVLKQIKTVTPAPGVSLQMLTDTARREAVVEYIRAGDWRQFADPAFVAELVSWIRFNKPEAFHSHDGLYVGCTGNPDVPRWLGRRFLTESSAGQQADTSAKKARSSSGLVVIAAASDDIPHWIETGRLYERLALTLTTSGVQLAFLNQPAEVPALRAQLSGCLGLGTALPQLVIRFGHAPAAPFSLRRPLEEVLV